MSITHAAVKTSRERGYVSEWNADHVVTDPNTVKRSVTLIVAASDSLDKERADYVCDGTADQVQIIQAINALPAAGGTVKLLEGNFTITAEIPLNDNVALSGSGSGTVITIPNNHDANINVISAANKTGILVSDLIIDGNKANQSAGVMNGIYLSSVTGSWVTRCVVENMYGPAGTTNYGIYLTGSSENVLAWCTSSNNSWRGIELNASANNRLTGNLCETNGVNGLSLGAGSHSNSVAGNILKGNTYHGMTVVTSDNNVITGNVFQDNTQYGMIVQGNDNVVTGNTVLGNGIWGIFISGGGVVRVGNVVTGNTCYDNAWSGIAIGLSAQDNTVTGNVCRANGLDGILLDSNADNNVVVGNRCTGNGNCGIRINAADCDKNVVVGNVLINNTGAAFTDNGTNTEKAHNVVA